MICLFPLFGESWLLRFSVLISSQGYQLWGNDRSSRDINGSTKICSHFPIYSLILSIFIILPIESSSFIDLLKTMDEFSSERSKTWNIYTSSDLSPSQTVLIEREAPWKNFGSSMNAISFGFVATAVLISMFLIMAIFEHLFRPNPSFSSPQYGSGRSLERRLVEKRRHPQEVSLLLTNFEVSLYVELLWIKLVWFFSHQLAALVFEVSCRNPFLSHPMLHGLEYLRFGHRGPIDWSNWGYPGLLKRNLIFPYVISLCVLIKWCFIWYRSWKWVYFYSFRKYYSDYS